MSLLFSILRIIIPIFALFIFNLDITYCDSSILETPPLEETFSKESIEPVQQNFVEKNAVIICQVLFVIAVTCTIGGVYICETYDNS